MGGNTKAALQLLCNFIEIRLWHGCPTDSYVWQYNQHLPIRIQQEIQEAEVKLAFIKRKNKKRYNSFC